MSSKNSLWDFFQNFGKSLMLPVALLASMGIILGLGASLSSKTVLEIVPFFGNPVMQMIFRFMVVVGSFAFINLPILFAMAVPLGLVKEEKGIAAFSGYVGFVVLNLSINFVLTVTNQLAEPSTLSMAGQSMIMGIQSIDTGVLGGVIVGILVYLIHSRFYQIQLPDAFAFFGGARFVPIATAGIISIAGLIIPVIWPFFDNIIRGIGVLIQNSGVFGPFLFVSGERLLLPFGLHHILVAAVRFTSIGGQEIINGETIQGALNIYYSELAQGLPFSKNATRFLSQAKMPFMMFGLPGAAFAMYQSAFPENKKIVKSLLLSGALSCFLAGISEPIEFLFLFIAPGLYLFHVVMSGLGALVLALLGVAVGNTDGNIIDLVIFGILQGMQTKWMLIILVGIVWFFIYYVVFKFFIEKMNLKTPGRDTNSGSSIKNYLAEKILVGLGGKYNITTIDNCITRLRMQVKNKSLIDEELIKEAGALGVVILDDQNIQIIIGPQVYTVRKQLEKLL
ncbi:MAG: maltose/glucose-specific PTS transporter subunit IIBC [Brevinemataceae bacterium]